MKLHDDRDSELDRSNYPLPKFISIYGWLEKRYYLYLCVCVRVPFGNFIQVRCMLGFLETERGETTGLFLESIGHPKKPQELGIQSLFEIL